MKRFVVLCLVAAGVALADDAAINNQLVLDRLVYSNVLTDHFDYYVNVLDRGFPIGQVKDNPDGKTATYTNDMTGVSKAILDYQENLAKAYAESQKKAGEAVSEVPKLETDGKAPVPAPAPRIKVAPFTPAGLADFTKCAVRTLPQLKARLQLRYANDAWELAAVEQSVQSEQGDGNYVGPGGLACGKYLGQVAGPTLSTEDDVKILSALLARKDEERATLLKAYLLYARTQKSEKLAAATFWPFFWKRVGFAAVFSGKALPTLETVRAEFLKSEKLVLKEGAVTATLSTSGIERNIEEDWALAGSITGGAR